MANAMLTGLRYRRREPQQSGGTATMRLTSTALGHALAVTLLVAAMPASADVKAGVDAWQQADFARALSIWRPLAVAGDADAQFNMGQAYKLGRGVPVDLTIAGDWYRRAADQGHEKAQDNYGLILFQQGQRELAMPYIRRSADRGEPRAQYLLGTALFNGEYGPKDWVQAYALMSAAASAGLPQAQQSLAQMDSYIPEDQRRDGRQLALAMQQGKARSTPTGASATTPVKSAAQLRPVPKPVQSAPVPPSRVASAPASAPAPTPAPSPAPAKPVMQPAAAPVAAPATGLWRIQLGAFSQDAGARTLWQRLSAKVADLAPYQPFYVKADGLTRLQAGPLGSQADATRLCARVKASGADCLIKKL